MKSYKNTLYTFMGLALIGIISYFSFNAFNFESSNGVERQPKHSQVRIFTKTEADFRKIEDVGLHIDHAITKMGHYSETWLSEYEMNLLSLSGVPFEVLVDDWQAYYDNLPKMTPGEIDAQMQQVYERDAITHSIYGTMGGYMKYDEVVAKLDSMRMWYPQFISAKYSVGTTYEGRTMWAVRVTNGPDAPTGRPEVLMHALIHAREPESMETQFYYMFWLFENYNTDPTARYILNNREIYWIPVLNADGYVHNQTTNPNGGGMWRANKHLNSPPSLTCGPVDPNRNFGTYQFWNSSNNGSSTDPCSGGQGTYRGTLPFSELETQHIKTFVNSRNFKTAFSAHTYGNYLIKPWCWQDPIGTPDDAMYTQFLADMQVSNGYTTGFPSQTVGYKVRGGTDDWYYNDSGHAKIFSFTPETGNSFWPSQSEIIPLAQGMLFSNQYISLIAGPYVNPLTKGFNQPTYTPGQAGTFKIKFRNKGVMTANNVRVTLTPLNGNVTIPTQQYTYPNLATFATDSSTFNFTISGAAPNNCGIPLSLTIKLDTTTIYSSAEYILVGTGTVTLNDNASSFSGWTTNAAWNITTAQFNSSPSSFTDSPTGNYGNNINTNMTLATAINVSATPVVYLSFWHRYATEAGYDFCYVEVSSDNGANWQQVTSYNGNMTTWTQQTFDITSYAGGSTQLKIRFRLTSDAGLTGDGWYIDDVKLTNYCGSLVGVTGNNNIPLVYSLEQNYPNPFNPATVIKYQIPKASNVKISIFDILGKEVASLINGRVEAGYHQVEFDGSNFASGLYLYKIEAEGFTDVKKMILVK
ncbi:MAG TPA: M14 family zinc carboxypeptidase [Ignavibacteria bacterium]|nr:M14 family zinc carboxypeptidase [Ignavibacteria bacterium]HMQ99261.1 M14 family zinc carboxypeptidase [Ignavibacteria bacterium]